MSVPVPVCAMPTPEMVEGLKDHSVLVIGDLMLDAYLEGDAERLSPEAPVPVIGIQSERHFLGGAGNVARNIVALGGKATLLGVLGADAQGERVEALLKSEQIVSAAVHLQGRPTTVKTRVMARRQQMLRLDWEDATALSEAELNPVLNRLEECLNTSQIETTGSQVIILSDYHKGLVTPSFMARLEALLDRKAPDALLLVDPKPSHLPLYGRAYLITPNAKETSEGARLPTRSPKEILAAGNVILQEVGARHLLTTLGPEGMALFMAPDEVWHVPTMAREVFDVTGAGDTVIATVGLALASGCPLLPACILANYAAGLVVAQVGAATASPHTLKLALQTLPSPALTRWD